MNRATICGNVGKDPEIRHTKDGRPIANFSVATSERWTDKTTGEKKEKTEWHRISCFNEVITGVVEKYVKKGSKVLIEGVIRTRQYTDDAGIERYSTEIVIEAFNCSLELVGANPSSRPGFSDNPDDYGKTRTVDTGAPADDTRPMSAPPKQTFVRDLDDEVPF